MACPTSRLPLHEQGPSTTVTPVSMELIGYWRSSAAYRVRIALNLKGVARRFGIELNRYARLLRAESAALSLPAFERAAPEKQPDAKSS